MAQPHDTVAQVAKAVSDADRLAADAELARLRAELASTRARYKAALSAVDAERARADALVSLKGIAPAKRRPAAKRKATKNRATAILMLSDVHCEERVLPETVNGKNDYSLDVCEQRLGELERRFLAMLEHERTIADVGRVLLWLGGDFITGHIHPDCVEVSQLSPPNATRWIAARLRGLIDTLAGQTDSLVVATNAGNHGRSTEKLRIGTELDHSWEQLMYHTLQREERNRNVEWQVSTGHHGYIDLDGFKVRTMHGHSIRYQGGVLGLPLPATKAVRDLDATQQPADLTLFGHWHTWAWVRGSRYVSNGSVIGPTPYSTFKRCSDEPPCQGMAIIDHGRHEVTKAYPLFCDGDRRAS
jgi:hypothetical protein